MDGQPGNSANANLHSDVLLLLLSASVPSHSNDACLCGTINGFTVLQRQRRRWVPNSRSIRPDDECPRRNGAHKIAVLQLSSTVVLSWPAQFQCDDSRPRLVIVIVYRMQNGHQSVPVFCALSCHSIIVDGVRHMADLTVRLMSVDF